MIRRLGFFAFALGIAWSCSDDEEPPPKPTPRPDDAGEGGSDNPNGGRPATGGSTMGGMSGAAGGGGADGGEPSTGGVGAFGGEGDGGMPGDAGIVIPPCPSDSVTEPPVELTTVCDPLEVWGAAMEVPNMAESPPEFVAITPDELTLAAASQTLMGVFFRVSDRTATTDPFPAGQDVPLRGYVALSPDGLRLIGLAEGGQRSYFEVTRASRGAAFGEPEPGAFTAINADGVVNGYAFSGAAISADDRTLYYLALEEGPNTDPLRVSVRASTEPWPVGQPVVACEFKGYGGSLVRTPTGLSSDALTLFFFDGARGFERAAFRPTVNDPFVFFTNLGDRNRAQPNTACDRVYFGAPPRYSDAPE